MKRREITVLGYQIRGTDVSQDDLRLIDYEANINGVWHLVAPCCKDYSEQEIIDGIKVVLNRERLKLPAAA